jgi:histidine ammonia-lyase
VPTNANNQDVVGMGSVAVRHARRLLENGRRVVAIELIAAAEAADVAGGESLGAGCERVREAVRALVAPLLADRPLGADVERLAARLDRIAIVGV